MEPALPAPPEQLLGAEALEDALDLAEAADGTLPHFLSEQSWPKSPDQEAAEADAALHARGKAAMDKVQSGGGALSREEFVDLCHSIEPPGPPGRTRGRHR